MNAIALDLPGFGASPPPSAAMGAAGYADLIGEALGEFTVPPLVVAHSFGGRVAIHLAARGLVRGLLLTGVPLLRMQPVRQPGIGYRLVRRAHRLGVLSDERMETIRRKRGSVDYLNARGVMREVLVTVVNETYEKELSALKVPIGLVWGADDAEVPVAVAQRAQQILQGRQVSVHLEVVAGVDHMLPLRRPELLAERIADWDEQW